MVIVFQLQEPHTLIRPCGPRHRQRYERTEINFQSVHLFQKKKLSL